MDAVPTTRNHGVLSRGMGFLATLGLGGPARVPLQEGYAKWAPVYPARPHNGLMQVEAETVASLLAGVRATRALDVGTGTGRNLPLLRASGPRLVVGLDLSMDMLQQGPGSAARLRGDAVQLPLRAHSVDLVTSSLMAGDLADLTAWFREVARVLVPGGHFVFSDFHPSWGLEGWRRTFRGSDGREYELPYFDHPIEDTVAALAASGLTVRALREPKADKPTPVLAVIHAVRISGEEG